VYGETLINIVRDISKKELSETSNTTTTTTDMSNFITSKTSYEINNIKSIQMYCNFIQ